VGVLAGIIGLQTLGNAALIGNDKVPQNVFHQIVFPDESQLAAAGS
jgi:hypothetical protein